MRDAPYIEKAEREGIPHPAVLVCPSCGKETKEIYYNVALDVVGCPHCIKKTTVDEWEEDERE